MPAAPVAAAAATVPVVASAGTDLSGASGVAANVSAAAVASGAVSSPVKAPLVAEEQRTNSALVLQRSPSGPEDGELQANVTQVVGAEAGDPATAPEAMDISREEGELDTTREDGEVVEPSDAETVPPPAERKGKAGDTVFSTSTPMTRKWHLSGAPPQSVTTVLRRELVF